MDQTTGYLLAADALLALHLLFVVFVVLSPLLVITGKLRDWSWVRNPWFRWLHLVAIAVVVTQAWLGLICPLTRWEMALREQAGDAVYAGSFVAHWLEAVLYYRAPAWVFIVGYTGFGALVVALWVWVRPGPFRRSRDHR